MLGHLFRSRLKAAEHALRQGRLDEAYRIANAPDLRDEPRAVAVLGQLAGKFIARARENFAADRFAEALHDLDRAEVGGGPRERIEELRAQVNAVASEATRQEHSRRNRLDQARRRVEQGSLAAGQRILDAASQGDAEAEKVRQDIERRDHEAADVFAHVQRLIKDEQWIAAVERLARGKAIDPHDPACAKLEADLCGRILKSARQSIRDGRPGRAADELACLGELGVGTPARREVEQLVRLVREAGDALRRAEYDQAKQAVMRLHNVAPDVKWAARAVDQLGSLENVVTGLRAGPLGAFEHAAPSAPLRQVSAGLAETVALGSAPRAGGLPERLLLLVDGGGSYLLLCKDRASIGRAATSRPADVPIFSDLEDHHAEIARVGDDYFMLSGKDVEVGGKLTRHQLLQDGDRVVLGRKAKFTFRMPSRKSTSAALDLSETSKLPNDVRRVLLFERNAMVGFGPGFHVQCRMARNPLVLFERDGALWVRLSGRGRPGPEAVRLELGKTVEIDGVSMVAKAWSPRPGGARKV